MLKRILVSFFLVVGVSLKAAEDEKEWTKTNTALEVTYQGLLFLDWKQTSEFHRTIIKLDNGSIGPVQEYNPLLGSAPSQAKINIACGLSSIGHYYIAKNLSGVDRIAFQVLTILIEGLMVDKNYKIGVRIKW